MERPLPVPPFGHAGVSLACPTALLQGIHNCLQSPLFNYWAAHILPRDGTYSWIVTWRHLSGVMIVMSSAAGGLYERQLSWPLTENLLLESPVPTVCTPPIFNLNFIIWLISSYFKLYYDFNITIYFKGRYFYTDFLMNCLLQQMNCTVTRPCTVWWAFFSSFFFSFGMIPLVLFIFSVCIEFWKCWLRSSLDWQNSALFIVSERHFTSWLVPKA